MSISQNSEASRETLCFPTSSTTTAEIQQMVNKKIQQLPKEKLLTVLDFVEFLMHSANIRPEPSIPMPNASFAFTEVGAFKLDESAPILREDNPIFQLERAVDSGVGDLAERHDDYLYPSNHVEDPQ